MSEVLLRPTRSRGASGPALAVHETPRLASRSKECARLRCGGKPAVWSGAVRDDQNGICHSKGFGRANAASETETAIPHAGVFACSVASVCSGARGIWSHSPAPELNG